MDRTTRAFDVDLRGFERNVLGMGRLVKQQIEDATGGLLSRDVGFAERVAAADRQLDALQREIEGLALIRGSSSAIRMVNDFERIGDFANHIAKRVAALIDDFCINGVMPQFELVTKQVIGQLISVLESYERRDVGEALEVWRKDQDIDALNKSLFPDATHPHDGGPRNISLCIHLLFCSKNTGRMGDHITNIAKAN